MTDLTVRLEALCEEIAKGPIDFSSPLARALGLMQFASAEILRLRAELQWQPIETAPRDGTQILVWYPAQKMCYSVRYVPEFHLSEFGPVWATPDGHVIYRLSHWLPIPQPPEDKK